MRAAALADDTTGALEVGAFLASSGVPCRVTLRPEALADAVASGAESVVADTRTRHLSGSEAFRIVTTAANALRETGTDWLYKKTDSTLRGQIGAEVAALVHAFPDRPIVYVPAYPCLGRTVSEGVLRVNGFAVAEAEFARDPRNPVTESSVVRVLQQGGIDHVCLAGNAEHLRRLLGESARVLVCDGTTDADISETADVLAEWKRPFVAVGPGGFAEHWCSMIPGERKKVATPAPVKRWLLVCGSLHPMARRQAKRAADLGLPLLASPDQPTGSPHEVAIQLGREAAAQVRAGKAEGVIVFGGDSAAALFDALECPFLTPTRELLPGIPLSSARCGSRELPVITKAGGFGGENVIEGILETLRDIE